MRVPAVRAWTGVWLAGCLLFALALPGVTTHWAALPFVVGLVLFGMPHGAMDWVVLSRLHRTRGPLETLIAFGPYVGLIVISIALFVLAPVWATVAFLALTVIHFGSADARALGGGEAGPVWRWGTALSRGGLLLGGVFAAAPVAAWRPFGEIAAVFAYAETALNASAVSATGWVVVGVSLVIAIGCAVARRRREGTWLGAALDGGEQALTLGVALVAPPLFAVGVYFLGVHAVRYTMGLGSDATLARNGVASGGLRGVLRVHAQSLPLLLPSLPLVVLLAWPMPGGWLDRLAVGSIAFYMATTLPHHLLGMRLDSASHVAAFGSVATRVGRVRPTTWRPAPHLK